MGIPPAVAFGVLTFVATTAGVLAGYRMSRRRGPGRLSAESIGTVRAMVFPLVGLLLAFAFSDSRGRPVTDGFVGLQPREGWRVT
jgi:ABC-type spermidine/putrescine transport system permease subunit II